MHVLSRYRWPGLLAGVLLVHAAGCSNGPPARTVGAIPTTRDTTAAKVAPPKTAPAPVEVAKPIKLAELDKVVGEHKGKVVLIDFWFNG
jgi:hypothetical protein